MPYTVIDSIKIKAKLLQKAKRRAGKDVKLKDIFELLAQAAGFGSWREWRRVLNDHDPLLAPMASSHWHVWYSSYQDACRDLPKHGGFLLPYQKHYFICDEHYIVKLGLDIEDPDLKKVGRNWVEPSDSSAFLRLREKMKRAD